MIKVEKDPTVPTKETFNSLEIVNISRRPGRNCFSKYLIALLSYGGVPQEFFLNLLMNALEETRNVYSSRSAALRVASNHDGVDYGFVAQRMISSGIPLNEPYLQFCLSNLENGEKTKLKQGKIPVTESFYLMGTADPTGVLNNDEVCVILENGPISGPVLVYRNPGLHFGDVHIMDAVYVKELEEVVGNAKYGIFFSTKGCRSAAYEMATGDFDGDMYWVSRNLE
ncbi:putative RNA-dependent RNA polymerase 5 [Orobanche minor]